MRLYHIVQGVLAEAGIDDRGTIEKHMGTACTMGFDPTRELSPYDQQMLERILTSQLRAPKDAGLQAGKAVTASVAAESVTAHTRFEEIESLRGQNLCPRCKKEMNPEVKLADYQVAKYCKHCKVALWC